MTEERKKIYRAIARGMKKDKRRHRLKLWLVQKRSGDERRLALAVFAVLIAGLLFGFVLRGGEALYLDGRRLGYARSEEDISLAEELMKSDVREDLGRELTVPDGLENRWCLVPRFVFLDPSELKAVLMEACGESYTYRYVFFIGEKVLGAVTEEEIKSVNKAIEDYRKRLLGDYSWADKAEVLGDVWYSFRLAEQEDYTTCEGIKEKLEAADWFTVRYEYQKTEVETIPYSVDYTYTRELLETEFEVISEGKNGVASTVRHITAENGEMTEMEIVSRDVISEPINAAVRKGTRKDTGYYFYAPVDSEKISSEFGYRILRGERNWHSGVDFVVPEGTEVYAAAAGVVTQSGDIGNGAYGNVVVIDHGDGFLTYYAHNSELLVQVGDQVKKGTLIALSGNTGNSTGPHLHFEVRLNGVKINPFRYMARPGSY